MIGLVINGEHRETRNSRLDPLIAELGLHAPLVLVEYNGNALLRSEWGEVLLKEGDHLELMSVAAGG